MIRRVLILTRSHPALNIGTFDTFETISLTTARYHVGRYPEYMAGHSQLSPKVSNAIRR